MILIWVARLGLWGSGRGLICRASPAPIKGPVMSDNRRVMERDGGRCVVLLHSHKTEHYYLSNVRSVGISVCVWLCS